VACIYVISLNLNGFWDAQEEPEPLRILVIFQLHGLNTLTNVVVVVRRNSSGFSWFRLSRGGCAEQCSQSTHACTLVRHSRGSSTDSFQNPNLHIPTTKYGLESSEEPNLVQGFSTGTISFAADLSCCANPLQGGDVLTQDSPPLRRRWSNTPNVKA